jgi:death-on-curing protein
VRYLDVADFLLIAEAVLDIPAETLAIVANLHLADSALNVPAQSFAGTEFYTSRHEKVAALGYHLIQNHALPDGNKRVGYVAMREFVDRNGWVWIPPVDDDVSNETVKVIWAVAAGSMTQVELSNWVALRMESVK